MSRKKLFAISGGLVAVLMVVLLIFTTSDMPQFTSFLGYSGAPVSGEGAIAYMSAEGNSQGHIEGDVREPGKENMHAIFKIDHHIEIPKDTHTGLPTGQRIHHPFTVTTQMSSNAPKLYKMCSTGEQGEVIINYWRTDESGREEHYFTIKLENAIAVNVNHYKPTVFLPENEPYGDMIEIAFTYSRITWIDEIDGVEYTDDWKK